MALNDLTDQNIQDTYQKVVQTDGTNLADGTGSLLPISFDGNNVTISGSLTANEYIVSSSVTNITIATLSGSTTFGDTGDDTHFFSGSLQLNGIGTSGIGFKTSGNRRFLDIGTANFTTINGGSDHILRVRTNLNAGRQPGVDIWGDLHVKTFGASYPHGKLITEGDINASGSITTLTNITASGDISASGTAHSLFNTAPQAHFGLSTPIPSDYKLQVTGDTFLNGDISAVTHITASGNISASATSTVKAGSGSFHILKGDTTAATGLSVSGYIEATHITASGNISSSGNIYGTGFYTPSARFGDVSTNNAYIQKSDGGQLDSLQLKTTRTDTLNINANGQITASGNLLVQGTYDGNITASANISASGTIIANQITSSGGARFGGNVGIGGAAGSKTLQVTGTMKSSGEAFWSHFDNLSSNSRFRDDLSLFFGVNRVLGWRYNSTLDKLVLTSGSVNHTLTLDGSGNISSSGNIVADYYDAKTSGIGYKLDGVKLVYLDNSAYTFGRDAATRISGSTIELSGGHVTASGNISSSGTGGITATRLNTNVIYSHDNNNQIDVSDQGIIGLSPSSNQDVVVNFAENNGVGFSVLDNSSNTTFRVDGPTGNITASGDISSSGQISGLGLKSIEQTSVGSAIYIGVNEHRIHQDPNNASGLNISEPLSVDGNITASGNISASGTIITEDLQVDTITNQTTGGGIILDSAGFIGLDSSGGDIRFRDAGTNQLHFDMDGTDGAQVISPSVAGDDIIFKNQGGDSVLTLKSEGQTEIHSNITASGNISASGTITADDLHLPSTSPSTTSNLLYVSSSTAITGSRSANNLMYSGSMIGTGTGIIHIMHGSYKKASAHTTRTYISFGTGDKENTAAGNGYVRYHPPYGGKIRKFTAAGSLGGSKIGVVTFEFYINGSIVSAATCTATVNPQDTMVDIDFNDAAIFDKGDKVQIALTSAAADGTDYWIYWNSVFEFNVD